MKNLLVAVVACLSLTACMASTDSLDSEDTINNTGDNNGGMNLGWHQDQGPVGCNVASFLHVSINDHEYWVQVPTLCDPTPYIFKGDPGPDVGDPYEDRFGPVAQEEILEAFNARTAPRSRANLAVNQQY